MKIRFVPIIMAGLFTAATFMTSCLNDDTPNITYSSETSITSFSLGTLHCEIHGLDKDGNDSVYTDTISMSDYPFTINQLQRTIENKDSLPVGTDISRVLLNIKADTDYILYGKINEKGGEAKDTLWTSGDTINFAVAPAEGLQFKVMAYSGVIGKPYTVKVNVHKQVPDSLEWNLSLMGSGFQNGTLSRMKSVCVGNRLYVFGEKGGKGVAEYCELNSNNSPGNWTTLSLPEGTDSYSVTSCGDDIYFIATGTLYRLTSTGYVTCSDQTSLSQLIAASAVNGENLLYTRKNDGQFLTYNTMQNTWSPNDEIENCPDANQNISSVNLPLSYNNAIVRTILMGYNETEPEGSGFVATHLSNETAWTTYKFAQADTFRCPNIADPTMIFYNKKIYAYGGNVKTTDYEYAPFSIFFESADNGLTWNPVQRYVTFPKGNNAFTQYYKGNGSYASVVDTNNFIWIIWNDGQMSRGRINHFGFAAKWE